MFFKNVLACFFMIAISSMAYAQRVTAVRPWLGVAIEKGEKGVKVKSAFPDTPAFNAGIIGGDEILKVGDKEVKTPDEMIAEIGNKGVGHTVKVEFLREGLVLSKEITLVVMPDMMALTKKKLLGQPVPQFEATRVLDEKNKFSIKKQLGKVTILEFWATWCVACMQSQPRLLQFAKENQGKIDVISITDEELPVIKKYLDKLHKLIPAKDDKILFLKGSEGKVHREFMASSIPMFVLIDKKGTVVDLDLGGGSIMERILAKAQTL